MNIEKDSKKGPQNLENIQVQKNQNTELSSRLQISNND